MKLRNRVRRCLRSGRGSAAVEFLMTAALLIGTFAVLVSAMIYVTEYYTASYIARRVVRDIEVTGAYDAQHAQTLASELGGDSLEELAIAVDAPFLDGSGKIQLLDDFRVTLTAAYPVNILQLGSEPLRVRLPVEIRLSGRSEVFWK